METGDEPFLVLEEAGLRIIPLPKAWIEEYLEGDPLYRRLGLPERGRLLSDEVIATFRTKILPLMEAFPEDERYLTVWIVIDLEKQAIVSAFVFKGAPDSDKSIEIGYETFEHYRNQGYMSRTIGIVSGMLDTWPEVDYLYADTEPGNHASIKVLQSNGFSYQGMKDGFLHWRLDVWE